MKPNNNFKLDIKDIDTIEQGLFQLQKETSCHNSKRVIIDVLAKLHHQKVWYRPKKNYVSG